MKSPQEEVGPSETVTVITADKKETKQVEVVPDVVVAAEKPEKKHKHDKKVVKEEVKEEKIPEPVPTAPQPQVSTIPQMAMPGMMPMMPMM